MDQMGIGEFAKRSRLSAKALRLYDELGLLPPARVDEGSGYRFYEPGQLKQARLIATLRQLQVPLAEIKAVLPLEPAQAAERVRAVLGRNRDRAHGPPRTRRIPDRRAERTEVRHVRGQYEGDARAQPAVREAQRHRRDKAWAFGKEFIALLRHYQLPEIEGHAGAFFCIFWGEVSEDSDGPMEWCRPVPPDQAEALAARCPELVLRAEPAHQEAFVKIGDGQIDGAEWQVVSRSLEAWSEQQHDLGLAVGMADLGLRITYLPSEVGQDTYQDFAVPFNGQPPG